MEDVERLRGIQKSGYTVMRLCAPSRACLNSTENSQPSEAHIQVPSWQQLYHILISERYETETKVSPWAIHLYNRVGINDLISCTPTRCVTANLVSIIVTDVGSNDMLKRVNPTRNMTSDEVCRTVTRSYRLRYPSPRMIKTAQAKRPRDFTSRLSSYCESRLSVPP